MFNKMNERIRRMNITDIGLIKWSVFFAAIIIIKFFPQLLKMNYVVLFVLMILCAAKPFYKFWIQR